MAKKFKIIRENNYVDAVVKTLNESKENIKDIFVGLRFNDGTLLIIDADVPFETLCVFSKKLDLLIDHRQLDEEEDEEGDEEELE